MEALLGLAGLFLAGVIAGGINSVAGGGSLISFPSLIAYGVPAIPANATNTTAVCPGALASAFGYRNDLPRDDNLLLVLLVPSLLGSLIGAVVLVSTPSGLFTLLVPFLVLFATVLFGTQDLFAQRLRMSNRVAGAKEHVGLRGRVWGVAFQFLVAAYGGYFGAGIGILMLASFGLMGLRDVHRMNATKTVLASVINGVAMVYFVLRGIVVWPLALLMAVGAISGGYAGARLAKRVDQRLLRLFIVIVGLAVSAWLFVKAAQGAG